MNPPAWIPDAAAVCASEAATLHQVEAAMQALPKHAPEGEFLKLYAAMLEARDRLYEAWISQEMDA